MSLFMMLVVMGAAGYGFGYYRGWVIGIEETEQRWSDTASKADWICRYGDASTLDGRRRT